MHMLWGVWEVAASKSFKGGEFRGIRVSLLPPKPSSGGEGNRAAASAICLLKTSGMGGKPPTGIFDGVEDGRWVGATGAKFVSATSGADTWG